MGMLAQQKEQVQGLRPHSEIEAVVSDAIQIKKRNPGLDYKIVRSIGKGGQGNIFLVQRITDD